MHCGQVTAIIVMVHSFEDSDVYFELQKMTSPLNCFFHFEVSTAYARAKRRHGLYLYKNPQWFDFDHITGLAGQLLPSPTEVTHSTILHKCRVPEQRSTKMLSFLIIMSQW